MSRGFLKKYKKFILRKNLSKIPRSARNDIERFILSFTILYAKGIELIIKSAEFFVIHGIIFTGRGFLYTSLCNHVFLNRIYTHNNSLTEYPNQHLPMWHWSLSM